MDEARLINALTKLLGSKLAGELVSHFIKIRQDFATRTFERASPGKFVETVVQCIQQVATGAYEPNPVVDYFLDQKVENLAALTDGLRICAPRVARALYTLR